MKFTLAEIKTIGKNMHKLGKLELPISVSYRLTKLIEVCGKELALVEKARTELVKKHGEGDGKGGFRVKKENESRFREEYGQLLMEEVEIDFEPIPIDDLEGFNVSPIDLSQLGKIIREK